MIVGTTGIDAVKSGVSGNGLDTDGAPEAVYVLVSPINSSKSSQINLSGMAKKCVSKNALSIVGWMGVAKRAKPVMLQENESPGIASSAKIGINWPALKVVFNPWLLSKVERLMSALGISANVCWLDEPIRVLPLCGFFIMSGTCSSYNLCYVNYISI